MAWILHFYALIPKKASNLHFQVLAWELLYISKMNGKVSEAKDFQLVGFTEAELKTAKK